MGVLEHQDLVQPVPWCVAMGQSWNVHVSPLDQHQEVPIPWGAA